jgi:hypothetical protein
VLGFTNANFEAVCCVIIIAGSEINGKHIMGLQPWVDVIGDPEVDRAENSHGLDKYYPFGPTCIVSGKKIETFVTCSESGRVTSLRDSLKQLDAQLTFDRSEAIPFLLLDGHRSHFQLPFLDYVTAQEATWTVFIGVPYDTHVWKVADSSEQLGAFKMAITKAKQRVMDKTMELQLVRVNIERHDIVGIVYYAWEQSFAFIATNKEGKSNMWMESTYL